MKNEILQILNEELYIEQSGYMNGYADIVGCDDAADAIAQLMCDMISETIFCYNHGENWENDIIMYLERDGFTKEQITHSLNKIKAA